jgi:hypothetical protein
LGGIEKSKDFTGAVIDGWFALDLTSDIATGLGGWTVDEIATYLKTGVARQKTTTLGPMAEVIRNSLSYLSDDDLQAMAEYLKSIPPDSTLRRDRSGRIRRATGATLYLDPAAAARPPAGPSPACFRRSLITVWSSPPIRTTSSR